MSVGPAGPCVLGMVGQRPGQPAQLQPAPACPAGTKTLEVKEWYQNREDMLELRHINNVTGMIIDYFKPGHPQALRGEWLPPLGQRGAPVAPYTPLSAASMWLARGGKNQHPGTNRVLRVASNRNHPASPCKPGVRSRGAQETQRNMTSDPSGK